MFLLHNIVDFQLIRCCLKLLEAVYPHIEGHTTYERYQGHRKSCSYLTTSRGGGNLQGPTTEQGPTTQNGSTPDHVNNDLDDTSNDMMNVSVNTSVIVEKTHTSNGDTGTHLINGQEVYKHFNSH